VCESFLTAWFALPVSDLTAEVSREISADEPQQPVVRVNSADGDDDDVFESRTAFAFARVPNSNDDDGDDDDDDQDQDQHQDGDAAARAAAEDRFFYSHGVTRAAGVDVPRSESSRHMRLFNSSRRTASTAAADASATASDGVVAKDSSVFTISSLFSFLWDGLTTPFVKGAFIGVGMCVVHYLLVVKRRA
jgi:hypothetical protein